MKVLWISRHYPYPYVREKLIEVLESRMPRSEGNPVVIHFTEAVRFHALPDMLDTYKPDAVVAVLPLRMQEVLVSEINARGIRPLIRPIFSHRNLDDPLDENEEWEFHGFEEILELTVKTRTLYLRTEGEQAFETGEIHRHRGEFQEAITKYTEAIRLIPGYSAAFCQRGVVQSELGAYRESITDLTEAILSGEDFQKAFYHRANSYRMLSEDEHAIRDYTESIRLRVELSNSFYYRGISRYFRANFQDAIDDFTEAIRLDSGKQEAFDMRGSAYFQLGEKRESINDYTSSIKIRPNVDSLLNRGIAYVQLGEHQKAIDDYTKAIQLQPNDAQLFHNRARAFDELNMLEKARRDRQKAAELTLVKP